MKSTKRLVTILGSVVVLSLLVVAKCVGIRRGQRRWRVGEQLKMGEERTAMGGRALVCLLLVDRILPYNPRAETWLMKTG